MLIMTMYTTALSMLLFKKKTSPSMLILTMITMKTILLMNLPLMDYPYLTSSHSMMDSMSILMVAMSMWITSLMLMTSHQMNNKNMFMSITILLMISLVMSFSMNNLTMFYIWFEFSLIPTMLLIMIWGNQPERMKASFFIMIYTITASIPLLLMILKMFMTNGHSMFSMSLYTVPIMNKYLMMIMLTAAFMVKLPLFGLHLWLPKAHVEAPLAGSMVLAAILLKLGGYGLLRLKMLITCPTTTFYNTLMSLAINGAIITNMMCLRQTDLKALIAYSSIGHMSLLVIGTLSSSKLGQYGSLIMMLTHGLTSSCMFMLADSMYKSTGSRNILMMSGLLITMPNMSLMWMITSSMNMALPPSMNIIGEMIIMMSSITISKTIIMLLMTTTFTTTLYSLYLYTTINHSNLLKKINPMNTLPSKNLTSTMSHIWPLFILTIMPMKLMTWC